MRGQDQRYQGAQVPGEAAGAHKGSGEGLALGRSQMPRTCWHKDMHLIDEIVGTAGVSGHVGSGTLWSSR